MTLQPENEMTQNTLILMKLQDIAARGRYAEAKAKFAAQKAAKPVATDDDKLVTIKCVGTPGW